MRPILIIFSLFVLAPFAATAQEIPINPNLNPVPPPVPTIPLVESDNEPELSLEELVRRAEENNPRLGIARENLNAARHRAGASRAFPNTSLQLVPGFTGNREARDDEVILAQPLDFFGVRRARAGVLVAEERRALAGNTLARRALVIDVKNAAAQLFAAQEAENLERVQVEIAQLFRDAAARRAELGDVPPVQVQRVELELLRLQNDLSNARTNRLTRRAALNLLIGQAPASPLRVALPLDGEATALLRARPDMPGGVAPVDNTPIVAPVVSPTPATSAAAGGASVSGDLTNTRPDILGARATLEARQAQTRVLNLGRLPAVELQARRSAFFGRDGSYALRAIVTLPLFDFGTSKGERRAAEAEVRAQEATVKLLQQQAAAQVESARARLEQSRQNLTRYREHLLPLTLDLLRKTQIGYAQGASTYLEVLEAQRTLRQIQTEYLQALVGVQTGEIALDAATHGGLSSPETADEYGVRGVTR